MSDLVIVAIIIGSIVGYLMVGIASAAVIERIRPGAMRPGEHVDGDEYPVMYVVLAWPGIPLLLLLLGTWVACAWLFQRLSGADY